MMRNCRDCVHNPICQLWRNAECQDAGCYSDDCFQRKQPEKSADEMFRELGYRNIGNGAYIDDLTGIQIDIEAQRFGFCRKFTHYEQEDFCAEEILACAKLIQEMEAHHEAT